MDIDLQFAGCLGPGLTSSTCSPSIQLQEWRLSFLLNSLNGRQLLAHVCSYLQQHARFLQRQLPGLVLQDVLPSVRLSHHVTLELWVRSATRRLGAAGREQLLQPAAILSPGRVELLLLQVTPCFVKPQNQ